MYINKKHISDGVVRMLYNDYIATNRVYHVVSLNDLDKCLNEGIHFDDKGTYQSKYSRFHKYFDDNKIENIPDWVVRQKAIFASLNFKNNHKWHSHSALLSIKINENKSWICNENIANFLFEPFVLQETRGFSEAYGFIHDNGKKIVKDYWVNSTSFTENLKKRNDLKEGYDAEVLIMHDIPPSDIECLLIISDHRIMSCEEWKSFFRSRELNYKLC